MRGCHLLLSSKRWGSTSRRTYHRWSEHLSWRCLHSHQHDVFQPWNLSVQQALPQHLYRIKDHPLTHRRRTESHQDGKDEGTPSTEIVDEHNHDNGTWRISNPQKEVTESYSRTLYRALGSLMLSRSQASTPTSVEDPFDHQRTAQLVGNGAEIELDDRLLQQVTDGGCTLESLQEWSDFLTIEDSVLATRRLAQKDFDKQLLTCPPALVLSKFLLRKDLAPEALRVVLQYSWHLIWLKRASIKEPNATTCPAQYLLDDSQAESLLHRLLHHCRASWPEAIVTVTHLFIEAFGDMHSAQTTASSERSKASRHSTQTRRANRFLEHLSKPIYRWPLALSAIQERAQFDLLEWMSRKDVSLTINRTGFQSIIRVQLANPKTESERSWAELKGKSWPPWKQDRTGLDADIGPEDGISRAMHAIRSSREAGYASTSWEDTAQILAGWDVDGSPTIQTRASLIHQLVSRPSVELAKQVKQLQVWPARVRATRTLEEAYSAYLTATQGDQLSYDDEDLKMALLEKIAADDDRLRETKRRSQTEDQGSYDLCSLTHPGDGPEVLEAPSSPKEGVFLRTPPPTFERLMDELHESGRLPRRANSIAFVLSKAPSLETGFKYVEWFSEAGNPDLTSLLSFRHEDDELLRRIPVKILHGWTRLLCRRAFSSPSSFNDMHFLGTNTPLQHAIQLLKRRAEPMHGPWHEISRVLAGPAVQHQSELVRRFSELQNVRRHMKEIGLQCDVGFLYHLCKAYQKAFVAAKIMSATGDSRSSDEIPAAHYITDSGFSYVRKLFYLVYGTPDVRQMKRFIDDADSEDEVQKLPDLLAVPYGHVLHAYARAIGLSQNWHAMLEFARWLHAHQDSIARMLLYGGNHERLTRRAIVSLRAFGEFYHLASGPLQGHRVSTEQIAPRLTIDKIKDTLQGCGPWAEWASDEEVQDYLGLGRGQYEEAPAMATVARI